MLKYFKNKITFLTRKDNQIIFYNSKKIYNFKNFYNFQYFATQTLTNLNFYLSLKNKSLIIKKNVFNFKFKIQKFTNTKLNY